MIRSFPRRVCIRNSEKCDRSDDDSDYTMCTLYSIPSLHIVQEVPESDCECIISIERLHWSSRGKRGGEFREETFSTTVIAAREGGDEENQIGLHS